MPLIVAVSPTSGTTAITTATNRTSRQRGIRTRATELTTIIVTHEVVDAKEPIFTVSREPKLYSTLNKGADTGRGRARERDEEETILKVNS
jgi:hypothetical protein